MNNDIYTSVKQKAMDTLAEKEIVSTNISFRSLQINPVTVKFFWFVSGVKRKLSRRFGK